MFDHRHYVPILRWKQAEWQALQHLSAGDRKQITPVVEITPRSIVPRKRRPTVDRMLEKNVTDMRESWGNARLFVDLWHLGPNPPTCNGRHPFVYLSDEARVQGISLIPVTGLDRGSSYQSAIVTIVAKDGKGACIRLLGKDFARASLPHDLQDLANQLGLKPPQVDLLLDCQSVSDSRADWAALIARVPHLSDWRTFTLVSGAFPVDLTGFRVGQHPLPRLDWQAWRRLVDAATRLPRLPAYGDYTIQHPNYAEPPDRPNFSASIRYTAENHWVIMRGEGVFHDGSPGFMQWPANAQLLCARPEFCGEDFSYGDRYIFAMGHQTQQTGSAATWLRAGINHHLAFVARQIANLFGT